jgi:hypothetical protein
MVEIIKVNTPSPPEYRPTKNEVVVHGKAYRFENPTACETAFKELSRAYDEKDMKAVLGWMKRYKSLVVRKEKLRTNPSSSVSLAEYMRAKVKAKAKGKEKATRNALIPKKKK